MQAMQAVALPVPALPLLPPQQQVGSPPKRRRLSGKQARPDIASPPKGAVVAGGMWQSSDETAWEILTHRGKSKHVYNKFYWWFRQSAVLPVGQGDVCSPELWALAQKDYNGLSRGQKNRVLRLFLMASAAPPWVMTFAVQKWPLDEGEREPAPYVDTHTVLLTYQGQWGLLQAGPSAPGDMTPDALTEFVKGLPGTQSICDAFHAYAQQVTADLFASVWACSMEICLRTYEEEKVIRLHGHLYMKSEERKIRCNSRSRLMFMTCQPHLQQTLWNKRTARTTWAGAYYCLCPKFGSVFKYATVKPFRDFPIDPARIFNLIEGGKWGTAWHALS